MELDFASVCPFAASAVDFSLDKVPRIERTYFVAYAGSAPLCLMKRRDSANELFRSRLIKALSLAMAELRTDMAAGGVAEAKSDSTSLLFVSCNAAPVLGFRFESKERTSVNSSKLNLPS